MINNWKVVRRFVYELSSDTLTFNDADTCCVSSSLNSSSSSSSINMEVALCRLESNCSSLSIRVGEFSNSFSFGVAMAPFNSSNNNNELFGERIDSWGICIRGNKCVLGTCGEYFIDVKPITTGDILSLDIDLSRERIAMVINGALVQEWSLPSINYSSLVSGVTFEGKGDVDILPIDTPYEAITWVRQNIAPISSTKERYKQIVSNLDSMRMSQHHSTAIGFPENSISTLPLNNTTFTLLDKMEQQQDVRKNPYLQDVAEALGFNNTTNANNTSNNNNKRKKVKNISRKNMKGNMKMYKSNKNQININNNVDLSSLLAVPPSLIEPHHPDLIGSHIESNIEKLFPHLGIQRGMQSPISNGGPRSRPKKNKPSRSAMPREKPEGDANLFVTGCDSAGGTGKLPVLFSSGDFMASTDLIPPILLPESDTTATTTVDKYNVDDMVSQSMAKLNERRVKQLRGGESSMTVESMHVSSLSASQYRDTLIHNVVERGAMKLKESHDITFNNNEQPSSPVEKFMNFIAKEGKITESGVKDDNDKENITDYTNKEIGDISIISEKNSMNMSLTRQGSISSIMSTVSRKMRKLLGIGPSKDRYGKKEHRFGAYAVEAPDVDPQEPQPPSKTRAEELWDPNPRLTREKSSPKKVNTKPSWRPSGRLPFEAPPLPAIVPTSSEPEPESESIENNNDNDNKSSISLEAEGKTTLDVDNSALVDNEVDNESDDKTLDLFKDIKKLNRQVKSLPYGLSMVYSDPKRVKEMAKPSLRRLELNGLLPKNDKRKSFTKLPLPLYLSIYNRLKKNEFHFSIEYCMHCQSHVTLKHDPRKYEDMALSLMDLLKTTVDENDVYSIDINKGCYFELLPIHPKGYYQGRMKESLCIDCDTVMYANEWYQNCIEINKNKLDASSNLNKSSSNPSLVDEKFDEIPLNQRFRTGALEIQVAFKHPQYGLMATTLHSKLTSRNWPNPTIVMRRLKLFLSICAKDNNAAIINNVDNTVNNTTVGLEVNVFDNQEENKGQSLHEKNELVIQTPPIVVPPPINVIETTTTEVEVNMKINTDDTNVSDNKEKKQDVDNKNQEVVSQTLPVVQPTYTTTTIKTTEAESKEVEEKVKVEIKIETKPDEDSNIISNSIEDEKQILKSDIIKEKVKMQEQITKEKEIMKETN